MLLLHWFYKGCPRKTWKNLCKNNIVRGQPAGHGLGTGEEGEHASLPHNSPSYRIESLISRSLARSHSQRTHTRVTPKSLKKHWFCKVVREKGCFYIGFTRLSAKKVVFTLVLQGLSAKNGVLHWFYKENSRTTRGQPGHGFGRSSSRSSSSRT